MYLKSLKIVNFRKFGELNNEIEFVAAKNDSQKSNSINIAPSTTLIVGKNNSGKTTITNALSKVVKESKFGGHDFNFVYLNKLISEYKKNKFEEFPQLEFEIQVGIDLESNNDLVTNVAPFLDVESVNTIDGTGSLDLIIKYELRETTEFKEKLKFLLATYKGQKIFRKFLQLIDNSNFQLNYYRTDGTIVTDHSFKLSNLIEIEIISANKVINDRSLSKTFNEIINFRYKTEKKKEENQNSSLVPIDEQIDKINDQITESVANSHTASINKALGKIESNNRLEVRLSAELTFDKMMMNIIKYEYSEGKYNIPEGQFGLGYSNLMTIIGKLIDYIEKYPKQECHSKINLICIEEPEAFMHSQMQELFIKHINDAVNFLIFDMKKDINSQLIITSHSSHILNSKIHSGNSFDNISYMFIKDSFSNVVNLNDNNVLAESLNAVPSDDVLRKEKLTNDLKFLKKHIKYKVSELFFCDAAIFVEGVTEETLLSHYIANDNELRKYYISIFNINGAHALVYKPLIKILNVPTLVLTDLDIKRDDLEKENFTQISSLSDRETTNSTISDFNPKNDDISNLKNYFSENNIFVVFQQNPIEGYYATSFEEAFVLANYKNGILNKVLKSLKPRIYTGIVGSNCDFENLKNASYKLQKKLTKSKSDFANELLYEIIVDEEKAATPKLPEYVSDGLAWLTKAIEKQVKGAL